MKAFFALCRILFICVFFSLGSTKVHAQNLGQEQFLEKDPLLVETSLLPAVWSPGQSGELILKLKLPPGFHAYEDKFELTILEPDGFKAGKLQISPLKKWFDKFSKKNRSGIENFATLKVQIQSPREFNKDYSLFKFELTYQACTESFCLFPTVKPLQAPIQLTGLSAQAQTAGIDRAGGSSSKDSLDAASADSLFSLENFKSWMQKSLWLALLISFIAGVLTSFTPCIFPMIPITLAILGRDVEKKSRLQNFLTSVFYVLGIAFTYSSLGLFAASSGQLFGANLGNPWVLSALCLLLLLMALSLFGLFELQVPAFIRNKFGVQKQNTGYGGAFVSGLLAGVVASPCVGPILVAILSYVATQKDLFLGFWLLFFYALGLGMIFLVLGLFTNLLNYLPKSGRWMNRFKALLGTLILGVLAYYLSLLLPNNWFGFQEKSSGSYVEQVKNPEWKTYSDELYAKAISEGRPIIIDFYADWCAACHELDQKTFSQASVKELGKNFVLLRFDATQDSPQMDAFKKKYMILGLPTVVFYSTSGQWRKDLTLTEFENPEKFLLRMGRALAP